MLWIFITFALLSIVDGQQCRARFNQTITGQCSSINNCQGTLLAGNNCEQQRCCVQGAPLGATLCLTASNFDVLYNSSRAAFLRSVLDSGLSSAGICQNCQAKAAFLAVAATMTNDFQTDESTKTDAELAADDGKYGNTQLGDGSRFRRRGFFGVRGRDMYQRLQTRLPQYQTMMNPEAAAIAENAAVIAATLWKSPDLNNGLPLTNHADGSFYGLSMIWHKLGGDLDSLPAAARYYSKFLRQLECGGELYPGQGPVCVYNATHNGSCSADCISGMEDFSSSCGCSGGKVSTCTNSPPHIQCCLDTCSQELKLDLGFVLDASGSVGISNYLVQLSFTKDLLRRANVGQNKTHVGIINYSTRTETLTSLNTDYSLAQKLSKVDKATYFDGGTNTALALREAARVFSYAGGRRTVAEGVTPVIFVITDGASDSRNATITAAQVLKDQDIILVSVGVGSNLDLVELHAICTPPFSENYFPISNYNALDQKLNQFTSKSCSEPAPVPSNSTVTVDIGKDKYKFLKVEIVRIGNKIQITVTLFNGDVKIFYSFTNKNPKDPKDFIDVQSKSVNHAQPNVEKLMRRHERANSNEVTLVIDKPDEDVEFAYIGIKGVEENNKFEVKFDDCALITCNHGVSLSVKSIGLMLMMVARMLLF